jgi:small subunit ribosomal protein S7
MRKNKFGYREIKIDDIYQSKIVAQLINKVMRNGKKELAKTHVYKALEILREKVNKDKSKDIIEPLVVLEKAKNNVSPGVRLAYRRLGGSTYTVPFEISSRKNESIALNFLVESAKNNKNKRTPMFVRLANEIFDAYNNVGKSKEKAKQIRKKADENKGYASLKW